MSEIMLILAKEWVIGVSVFCSLLVIGHIIFSVMLIRSCRENNYDIGSSAMFPVINLVIFVKNNIRKKSRNSIINEDEEFVL